MSRIFTFQKYNKAINLDSNTDRFKTEEIREKCRKIFKDVEICS